MPQTPQGAQAGFPEGLRATIATLYESVYPAINQERWTDGVQPAQTILKLLEPWPLTHAVPWPVWVEKGWCLFLLGMAAKSRADWQDAARRFQEAASVAPRMLSPSPTARALEQLAIVLAELKQYAPAAEELRGAIALCGGDAAQESAKLWLRLGEVYEHWRKRADAIRAYHKALEAGRDYHLSDAPEWVHRAYAGIVRCSFRDGGARTAPFWSQWLRAGRMGIAAFVVLTLGALACMIMAAVSLTCTDYPAPWSWMGMVGLLLIVLVLPSARRVSGPGFAFDLGKEVGPGFAFDLRAPADSEIPVTHPQGATPPGSISAWR